MKEKRLTLNDVGSELRTAIEASLAKKASDVVVMDLRGLANFTDFFLLCTGNSKRQLKTIAEAVEEALGKSRVKPDHIEGLTRGDWVLMDYVDFIVHVFTPRSRNHYDLERLWGDSPRLDVESPNTRDETGLAFGSRHR